MLNNNSAPTSESRNLDLLKLRLFRPMGCDGVYARTGLYESIVDALTALITTQRPSSAEVFRFPPVMARSMIERSGYLRSFPNLLGCMCCMRATEAETRSAVDLFEAGEDWTVELGVSDLVLTPAACYPVYPIAAERGVVPEVGYVFDVGCDCFRREPSQDLDRLQSFRMREFVRVGTAQQVLGFRAEWIERCGEIAKSLGLTAKLELASDPFFGRGGKFMAASQIDRALKFELTIPVLSKDRPTACMSLNYHEGHFGDTWDLRHQDGSAVHTGCVAFGMDRLALALFVTHGTEIEAWPEQVRAVLKV